MVYFYDLNTKMSFPINDRNKLYLSGYFGRDVFNVDESFSRTPMEMLYLI